MEIREVVKKKYGEAARRVGHGALNGCCAPITSNLYDAAQTGELPQQAVLASLGCGNPTALAPLDPGETVLDLGSGGGIDVLLSARRVRPSGKAYGLDMTDETLTLARGVPDVVMRGAVPPDIRRNMLLWVAASQEPWKTEDARAFLAGQGIDVDTVASQVENKFMSAFIRATNRPDPHPIQS